MVNPDDLSDELYFLYFNAEATGIGSVIFATLGCISYGISLVIFGRAIMIFRENGLKSRGTKLTLCACIVGFLLVTTTTAGFIAAPAVLPMAAVQLSSGEDAATVIDRVNNKEFMPNTIGSGIASAILMLFGDAVILWRTMVLFPDNLLLKVFLLFCWVADFAAVIATMVYVLNIDYYFDWLDGATGPLYISNEIANGLSILQNVVATAAISYRLWEHKKFLQKTLNVRSSAGGVLTLLVETGLFFCIVQIVSRVHQNLFMRDIVPNTSVWGLVFEVATELPDSYFAGNYAAIIYIIINKKKSLSQSYVENLSMGINVDRANSQARRSDYIPPQLEQ